MFHLRILLKTLLTIPLAIGAHLFGSFIVLVMIPTTVYDMIVQHEIKELSNGSL